MSETYIGFIHARNASDAAINASEDDARKASDKNARNEFSKDRVEFKISRYHWNPIVKDHRVVVDENVLDPFDDKFDKCGATFYSIEPIPEQVVVEGVFEARFNVEELLYGDHAWNKNLKTRKFNVFILKCPEQCLAKN